MMVLEGKQYSCNGGEGKAIQPGGVGGGDLIQLWWCWRGSNAVVMVVKGRQYSRGGVGGEAIQL